MGLLQSIAGGLVNAASRSRNGTDLAFVFHANPQFSQVALNTFQRCLSERGLQLTELIMTEAQQEVAKYPRLTMGEFLDGKVNKKMSDALSGR